MNESSESSKSSPPSSTVVLPSVGDNLVLWRGEGTKGYSLQFRHLEFTNAYMASLVDKNSTITTSFNSDINIKFDDATPTVNKTDDLYGAMQYIHTNSTGKEILSKSAIVEAIRRSSLVRDVYEIIAIGDTYKDLASNALQRLNDYELNMNADNDPSPTSLSLLSQARRDESDLSWCVRSRQYGLEDNVDIKNATKYGKQKTSSMTREKEAIISMGELLKTFNGPVRLQNPDCALYVFEGLKFYNEAAASDETFMNFDQIILVLKMGPNSSKKKGISKKKSDFQLQASSIAPKTRICITRTPLCPVAAFIMCNLAKLNEGRRVLDPFAGSCTTLLAAAMIAPSCESVGIEISGNDVVNRDDIMADFKSRKLTPPKALIQGDCTVEAVRDEARSSIDGHSFDIILSDPPYGRRESKSKSQEDDSAPIPLVQLVQCIAVDLGNDKRLLTKGGRLVAFVPTNPTNIGEHLEDGLPNKDQLDAAGLELVSITEQPLSETLSRWLAVYNCVK
eukprot:CAMPEP_0194080230 /NCGR_PEP_ID=MMETSP0149-20130528/6286_1 /TAXON_ID=122233 /ORGANISM="Chaetoceros debilis, Strain MM31A-1" /LENGTH=506 /DNA_ID=CAMNT_0038761901 /DNA_START=290 /DNA_END=1810 /DNA_ORIENTATION=+